MRPTRVLVWGCALTAVLVVGRPAQAGWNNVFQVCCHNCGSQPVVAMASPVDCAPPCAQPCPCPQQVCTTRYIQRCYYQPVTTYRTSFYYEPVTSYRTSYYYEPVTCYRYSCAYDPCSCSYQQVATPVTSYRLRSQCCPVTSYLQRCALQPVTSYQQMTYYEPQTTCCTPSCPAPCAPAAAVPQPVPVAPPVNGGNPPPMVNEQRQPLVPAPGAPNISESREPIPANPEKYNRNQALPYGQPQFGSPVPVVPGEPARKPVVRTDRIASLSDPVLRGQVLAGNQQPLAGAKLLLISADPQRIQKYATADRSGQFEVALASGGWLVYTHGPDGKPVFQQKIDVREKETHLVKLVSR